MRKTNRHIDDWSKGEKRRLKWLDSHGDIPEDDELVVTPEGPFEVEGLGKEFKQDGEGCRFVYLVPSDEDPGVEIEGTERVGWSGEPTVGSTYWKGDSDFPADPEDFVVVVDKRLVCNECGGTCYQDSGKCKRCGLRDSAMQSWEGEVRPATEEEADRKEAEIACRAMRHGASRGIEAIRKRHLNSRVGAIRESDEWVEIRNKPDERRSLDRNETRVDLSPESRRSRRYKELTEFRNDDGEPRIVKLYVKSSRDMWKETWWVRPDLAREKVRERLSEAADLAERAGVDREEFVDVAGAEWGSYGS